MEKMKNIKVYVILTVLVCLLLSVILIANKTNRSVTILDNAKRELLATNENVEEANYQVGSPATYVETLSEAVAVANENATITLLKDYSDYSEVTISKNLTIDLGDKTLNREDTIVINNGVTVTVKGTGTLFIDEDKNMFTVMEGSKLVKKGTGLWKAYNGYVIHSTNSSFDLYGGYLVSDWNRVIYADKIQKSLIKDTTVYTGTYTEYAIRAEGTGNLTISGNSKIGNGVQVSINNKTAPASVIGWASTGILTLNGNATVYASEMSSGGIAVRGESKINCYGNSSIYVNFDKDTFNKLGAKSYGYNIDTVEPSGHCILLEATSNLKMNSTGNFFTLSDIAVKFKTDDKGFSGYFTYTKGKFATRTNKYTVWRYDRYTTHYQPNTLNNGKPVKERFYEMNSYNEIKSHVWNVYEYSK